MLLLTELEKTNMPITQTTQIQSAEIASPELDSSGEFLDDYQLAGLLGGIGNNEGKALLLLSMANEGGTYTQRPMHRLLTRLPGMDSVDAGGFSTQESWCRSTIEPAGLVESRDSGGTEVTALGLRLGVPLAGLLLDHADRYDVPLVELFGETRSSSEVPSQLIRLRVIEELLTNPGGIQLSDLVDSSDASHQVVIEKQLRKLANSGLITYDDWDEAINQTRYQINAEHEDDLATRSGLTGSVSEYLLNAREASYDQITQHCIQKVPGFDKLDATAQSAKVSFVMSHLKRSGLVKVLEGREQPHELNVSLSPAQLELWTDLFNKLETFKTQAPEVLAKWTEVALAFITDPAKVKSAYERFRDSSARANPGEKSLGNIVLGVLQETDGPTSVREVVQLASNRRGSSVSHFGVVRLLNRFADEGLVDKERDRVLMFSKHQDH
jgi:hypothetical protein